MAGSSFIPPVWDPNPPRGQPARVGTSTQLLSITLITVSLNCDLKEVQMFAFCRAISVILGDKWKAMKQEDRREYVIQAKLLADEHKRVNPDCWKRKRNSEVS